MSTTREPVTPEAPTLQSIGRGRLIALVVAAVLVGTAGVLAFVSIPSVNTSRDAPAAPLHASFAAARMWFELPFTESDSFPHSDVLQHNGIDPKDVRFALAGVDGGNVWVARTDEQLCLLFAEAPGAAIARGEISCVPFEGFEGGGIHLRVKDIEVYWGGGPVITDPPTSVEPTVPPITEHGPGDIDAANSWFTESSRSRDEFPYPGNLTAQGIDTSQIRLAVTQNMPPVRVWVAKQGDTGFCLIATTSEEGYLSQLNCAAFDEFRTSGINIAVPGLAAFWDGNDVWTTR